jgi:transposase
MQITDAQWDRIKHHFPEEAVDYAKRGPKPVPSRQILEAILWILKTGSQWAMLP